MDKVIVLIFCCTWSMLWHCNQSERRGPALLHKAFRHASRCLSSVLITRGPFHAQAESPRSGGEGEDVLADEENVDSSEVEFIEVGKGVEAFVAWVHSGIKLLSVSISWK